QGGGGGGGGWGVGGGGGMVAGGNGSHLRNDAAGAWGPAIKPDGPMGPIDGTMRQVLRVPLPLMTCRGVHSRTAYSCPGSNSPWARWFNDEGRRFLPLWPRESLPRFWFRRRQVGSNL